MGVGSGRGYPGERTGEGIRLGDWDGSGIGIVNEYFEGEQNGIDQVFIRRVTNL